MSLTPFSIALGSLLDELSQSISRRDEDDTQASTWRKEEENLKSILLAISSLTGAQLLDKAMEISCQRDAVVEIRAECGRSMFKVKGKTGDYNVLLIGYCNCFSFNTERTGTPLPLCKHILAAHLAKAQGTVERRSVRDEDWAMIGWSVSLPPVH